MTNRQRTHLSEHQLQQAKMMNGAGITWAIIASHFNICPTTLRKQLKLYDSTNKPAMRSVAPEKLCRSITDGTTSNK